MYVCRHVRMYASTHAFPRLGVYISMFICVCIMKEKIEE